MGAYLYWTNDVGLSKILWFDVVTEEGQNRSAEATEHPVEEGVDVTDHVRPKVPRITLATFVSNTPISNKVEVAARIGGMQGIGTKRLIGAQPGDLTGHELVVPSYDPPLQPTPGSLLNAALGAISSLLTSKKQYKAQTLTFPTEFNNVKEVHDELIGLIETSQRVSVATSNRTYANMVIEDCSMSRTADTGTGATIHLEMKEIRVVSALSVTAPKPAPDSNADARKNKGAQGTKKVQESLAFKGIDAVGHYGGVEVFEGYNPAGNTVVKLP